jgi:alpha-1,3-fucosyltransferase
LLFKKEREKFIREMQKYMQLDWFGHCVKRPCPDKFADGRKGDCKKVIATEYKFFLAFENSICKDYVSEKLFSILEYNIIPVVYNGASNDFHVRSDKFLKKKFLAN